MDGELKIARKKFLFLLVTVFFVGLALGGVVVKTVFCEYAPSEEINKEENILVLGKATTTELFTNMAASTSAPVEKKCEIKVDVSGAVISPGVYCFEEGDIVKNAVESAGGFNSESFAFKYVSQYLNLAESLTTGLKIYVPFQDDVVCKKLEDVENPSDVAMLSTQKDLTDTALHNAVCVSINNASLEELDTLVGIGPSTAQKIVDGRPYEALEDLLDVSGIGDSTFEKIESDICL